MTLSESIDFVTPTLNNYKHNEKESLICSSSVASPFYYGDCTPGLHTTCSLSHENTKHENTLGQNKRKNIFLLYTVYSVISSETKISICNE
jgi:hypothetical protein